MRFFRKPIPEPAEIHQSLRLETLEFSRAPLGIAPIHAETQRADLVMDWGMPTGSVTVVALSDRNPSLCLPGGRGSIGEGQSRESIRKAAQNAGTFVPAARSIMRRATEYPLPGPEQVTSYALSDAGGFSESACFEELSTHRNQLANLGDALEEIITHHRLIPR